MAIELFLEKRMLEFLANAEEPDEEDAEGRGCSRSTIPQHISFSN